MKIPSSGNSHIFIGLVDKSKYKIEYLCKLILYYQLLIYFLYYIIYNPQYESIFKMERFSFILLLGCME